MGFSCSRARSRLLFSNLIDLTVAFSNQHSFMMKLKKFGEFVCLFGAGETSDSTPATSYNGRSPYSSPSPYDILSAPSDAYRMFCEKLQG